MSGVDRLRPRFVEEMPDDLDEGVIYVSLEHRSMLHLCACGCGSEVVLPLTPLDWRLTYDGEDVSLAPSIGSWNLPCRSHYFVERGRVRWTGGMSAVQVEALRRDDRRRRGHREEDRNVAEVPQPAPARPAPRVSAPTRTRGRGLLSRLADWLSGR
jgi:hypothetical protein